MKQGDLFGSRRLQMNESIDLTIASLEAYGPSHRHWAIAWSGGKDSTTLLTLVVYLIESGRVRRPERLSVLYADTRLELLPLWLAAQNVRDELSERGIETRTVMAPLDRRFLVYILGRGVPPPNNNTLRWCTRQIKIDPMAEELKRIATPGEKILMLTGVRQGESAIRDNRIAMSCGKNGAECGQGWYQETLSAALCVEMLVEKTAGSVPLADALAHAVVMLRDQAPPRIPLIALSPPLPPTPGPGVQIGGRS